MGGGRGVGVGPVRVFTRLVRLWSVDPIAMLVHLSLWRFLLLS